MRPIKFRAWIPKNKKMFYGRDIDLFHSKEGISGRVKPIVSADYDCNVQIMQFTGLKDKNGVEIYEGDIITYYDHILKRNFGLVDYCNITFSYVIRIKAIISEFDIPLSILSNNVDHDYNYSIIGNIYENPELTINFMRQS